MKKLLALGAAGAVFASLAFASAAALPIASGSPQIQAGESLVVACQTTPIDIVGFGVELDDLTGHTLTLANIDAGCAGAFLGVQITGTDGTPVLFQGQFTLSAASTQQFPIGSISLEDIEEVRLVIG